MDDPLEMRRSEVRIRHLVAALNDILTDASHAYGTTHVHIGFNPNGAYDHVSLSKIQALAYLIWLRAGNVGTWQDYRNRGS